MLSANAKQPLTSLSWQVQKIDEEFRGEAKRKRKFTSKLWFYLHSHFSVATMTRFAENSKFKSLQTMTTLGFISLEQPAV